MTYRWTKNLKGCVGKRLNATQTNQIFHRGFITNQQTDQLLAGLLSQVVEHCNAIAEIMGLNPVLV